MIAESGLRPSKVSFLCFAFKMELLDGINPAENEQLSLLERMRGDGIRVLDKVRGRGIQRSVERIGLFFDRSLDRCD